MPKCQAWNDIDNLCELHCSIPDECDGCSHGWLPFWSEAERAGLKAMGRRIYSITKAGEELDVCELKQNCGEIVMICAFVQAARRVKERK